MSIYDDEQAWHEAQMEYMERYVPMATEAEAHAEWHRNAMVPMGTPGCPQDACHPIEEPDESYWAAVESDYRAEMDSDWWSGEPGPGFDDGIPF